MGSAPGGLTVCLHLDGVGVEADVAVPHASDRRRVETRTADIAGFTLPSWSSVMGRDYVPWTSPRLVVDTALLAPDEAVAAVEAAIDGISGGDLRPSAQGATLKNSSRRSPKIYQK